MNKLSVEERLAQLEEITAKELKKAAEKQIKKEANKERAKQRAKEERERDALDEAMIAEEYKRLCPKGFELALEGEREWARVEWHWGSEADALRYFIQRFENHVIIMMPRLDVEHNGEQAKIVSMEKRQMWIAFIKPLEGAYSKCEACNGSGYIASEDCTKEHSRSGKKVAKATAALSQGR